MIISEFTELTIDRIDTTEDFPLMASKLKEKIIEIQEKVNEVIDVINVLTMPDDQDEYDDDDDEEEELLPGEVIIGRSIPKPKKQ